MPTNVSDFLLTQSEYANIRRCSERTVERERASGVGCRYIKIGRSVRYKQADVLEFIERHARQSTSENAPPEACLIDPGEWSAAVEAKQVERSPTDPTGAEAESGAARDGPHRAASVDRRRARGSREGFVRLDPGRPAGDAPPRDVP
jgi:hypothetical protein